MSTELTQNDIRALAQSPKIQAQLLDALPEYFTPAKFAVMVRTAVNKNPKLLECTPDSFLVSILSCAQMGLAPDGRQAHLIPRWNGRNKVTECTFQPDYKGLAWLARRSPEVADVYAEVVRDADVLIIEKGLNRSLIHKVDVRKPRGEIIGVYAVVKYKDGRDSSFEYLERSEVESVRDRSESWKAHREKGFSSPWVSDEGEMFKKTAIKRVLKLADLTPEVVERLNADPEMDYVKADHLQITTPKFKELPAPAQDATEDLFPDAPERDPDAPRQAMIATIREHITAGGYKEAAVVGYLTKVDGLKIKTLDDMTAEDAVKVVESWSAIKSELDA